MKKRILALALSVAMVLGAVSFTAFADEPAANPYASGLGDTASYLMKVPDAADLKAEDYYSAAAPNLQVRNENGENFFVLSGEDFKSDSSNILFHSADFTYGYTNGETGIPDEIALNTDITTMYIAVRVKLNDNSAAYNHNPAIWRFYLNGTGATADAQLGLTAGKATDSEEKANKLYWYDINDGSKVKFYPQTYYYSSGLSGMEFVGDMDGYLLVPLSIPYAEKLTADYWRNEFKGVQFFLYNGMNPKSSNQKPSSWADKELLIGDAFLVSDIDEFQKVRNTAAGISEAADNYTKYAPMGYEDTAYYGHRVPGFESFVYAYNPIAIGKTAASPTTAATSGSRVSTHTTKLPNGDRAYEVSLNEGATTAKYQQAPFFTYDFSRSDRRNLATKGLPAEITVDKINYFVYRIAVKGGAATDTAKLAIRHAIDCWDSTVEINAGATVKFMNANTGVVTEYTVDDANAITFTGEVDGWLIVACDDQEENAIRRATLGNMQEKWGQKSSSVYSSQYDMLSGWEGKTLYVGDLLFVNDADKFINAHCPHTQWTAGTVVAPTCKAGGYTPYTCDGCGKTENRDETAIIACDKNGGELDAKAPTCKEPGFSAAKLCSMCGKVSEMSAPINPIACDNKVDYPAKDPTCKEPGNEVGKKCSMCGEITEGGATLVPIACDKNGGDVAAKDPTCKEAGNEAGKKCSMCGEISEGGATLAIIAHNKDKDVKEVKATCKEKGTTAGKACSMCGEAQEGCEEIAIVAHDKDKDVAEVPATCTKEGTTAGKACSMCGEVQEGCEEIDMIDHDLKKIETVKPTTTEKGYDILKCKDCDYTENDNFVDELEEEAEEEKSPETGDNNVFAVVMMLVALGAATVLFASRKRARR